MANQAKVETLGRGVKKDPSDWMSRTLDLARGGRWAAAPNPLVGCVVLSEGEVVGEGYHERCGEAHAEVNALEEAGSRARGSTLFVNLEPCSHQGRTPPCVEAILEARVSKVVIAHRDPNPLVAGRGIERLREEGLEVILGVEQERALTLNWRYLVPKIHHRVAITLKWAMSLDGKIATHLGESQWISSPEARRWALELRETHDSILVGSGTVLADDPRLNRRLGRAPGPSTRVLLDRRLRISPKSRLFREPGPILIYTESTNPRERRALEASGAEVISSGAITPEWVSRDLYRRGLQSLLVEGGGEVHSAFLQARCYDRVAAIVGPLIIGGKQAPGPVGGLGADRLEEAQRLDALKLEAIGDDYLFEGMRKGCLLELFSSVEGS